MDDTMMASNGAAIREQMAREVKNGQELIMLKMPERIEVLNDLVERLRATRLTYPNDDETEPKEEDALDLLKTASLPAAFKKLQIKDSDKDKEQQQELQGDVPSSESSTPSQEPENQKGPGKGWQWRKNLPPPCPANKRLIELENELLSILRQQIIDAEQIRLMIHLLVPPIECGNNFGTAVQDAVLKSISNCERTAINHLSRIDQMDRAKIVTKIQKHPAVDDFKYHLLTHDQKVLAKLLQNATEARNNYMVVYDMVIKNWHRLTDPKDTEAKSLKSSTASSYIS